MTDASILHDALELVIADYVSDVRTGRGTAPDSTELMVQLMGSPDTNPNHMGEVLDVLLETDEQTLTFLLVCGGYRVVIQGLGNIACPPSVLAKACTHPHQIFRQQALHNLNCPVESAVLAALRDDT